MAPRIEFKEENVKKNDYDYPKFKLDKKGELARVAVLEAPVAEFVHNIRKPKLVGGVPQKETKSRRDGSQYEDYVYEFVSRPICLGDYGILSQDGSDPEHCPICAEAKKSDRFYAPQRRFALHLVKYETKANSTEVKEPFSASTQIYSFTDKVFSKLYEFKQQGFDLRKHDLIFKAENPAFHGYDISVTMDAAWLKGKERQDYIKALMAPDNLAPDLSIFCGSKKSEKSIEYDIRAVNEAWDVATGVTSVSAVDAANSSVGSSSLLEGDISSFLDNTSTDSASEQKTDEPGWYEPKADTPEPATSFEDLTGDSLASSVGADSTDTDDDDLDAILKGL
jgi:hypothetical protein